MTSVELIPLTRLSPELRELTGSVAPGYRRLWTLTVDGRITAEQVNGRYQVRRTDLPAIAASLGMTARATVVA